MASPTVRPGNGTPDSVAELSCWKLVRAFGCTDLVDRRDVGQRHQRAVAGAHLIAGEPVRRQPEVARHLRDDLIAAPIEIEQVDVVAAEQRGERGADIGHGDAEAVGLVVIDLELDLRRLEAQVGVGEDEQPALLADFSTSATHIGELPEVGRGGDDELHRRPAGRARQRRRRERDRLRRRRCRRCCGDKILQHLLLIAIALAPRLQQNAGEAPDARLPMPLMVNTCSFSGTVLKAS